MLEKSSALLILGQVLSRELGRNIREIVSLHGLLAHAKKTASTVWLHGLGSIQFICQLYLGNKSK